ncbi:MAG TPA: sulfite exporter TauE/SafE family protein [Anaerolineales bacterium]
MNIFPSPLLAVLVTAVAFLYASIGFGGATGYLAVMSQFRIDPSVMASTALVLNIFVAGVAFINYFRAGHLTKNLLLPFLFTSIPAAFIGGYIKLNDSIYYIMLYAVLTLVMLNMLFARKETVDAEVRLRPFPIWLTLVCGAGIGLLSGMVGIGGGVFLAPLIILTRWGTAKQAAATAAGFIVLNSISGLIGRVLGGNYILGTFGASLLPVGIFGALGGSYLGARHFSGLWTRRILGVVLLISIVNFVVVSLKK